MSGPRILVPVAASDTLRRTVTVAVDRASEGDEPGTVRAVFLPAFRADYASREAEIAQGRELLDRVALWIEEDAEARDVAVAVETDVLGAEFYPHTPPDVADVFLDEIETHAIDRVVFDARYDLGVGTNLLAPVERILEAEAGVAVEAVGVPERRSVPRLPRRGDLARYAVLFGLSFGFYLVLAGSIAPYELVTGLATAAAVTITMGGVTFWRAPSPRVTPLRLLRGAVYVPYLLVMIVQANLSVTRVILDPRASIEPSVVRLRPAVFGPFPLTTLANSITLTPGTLTMRVTGQDLLVHTLTVPAREDLIGGRLERAVRFVFYGRAGMRVPSPRERDDATVLEGGAPDGD
ncbi:MAG: monovalent cation/H+ antiporter subunit E [Halobacteriales archaeon]